MTGAPVPEEADAVVQVERTEPVAHATAEIVRLQTAISAGQNVVPRGSESAARTGLIAEGVRINAAHVAVMASVGLAAPRVSRQPRVAVIVTGDEVIDPSAQPSKAQIRNANGPALLSAIREAGGVACDFGVVSDNPVETRAAIARALDEGHDVLVLSGGVSAGAFDFVEGALSELDVSLHVTAVRVKPGAPFVFGTRGATLIFGLPGNPVSAQVTFELFVRPALLKMQGARLVSRALFEGTLVAPVTNRSGRKNYVPVMVARDENGLTVRPLRTQGSGDVAAHALANALAVLESERIHAEAGERVPLYPLSCFLEV
jgi:molybdopterin molybdotransferase